MLPTPALSVNELTTYRWTLDEDVYFAQKTGFDAIGLWRRKLSDFGEDRAVELLADSGLAVSCLGWAGGFTGGDGRSLDESIRDGLAAIGTAARVGAECLIVVAGAQNNHIRAHRDRLFHQSLDDLLMAAEVADVPLALKPMHPNCSRDWTFQSDLEEGARVRGELSYALLEVGLRSLSFPTNRRRIGFVGRSGAASGVGAVGRRATATQHRPGALPAG